MNDKFLTPSEVAQKLGVSKATVLNALKGGAMTYRQYGPRTIRIEEREVERYILVHTKGGSNGTKAVQRDEHGDEIIEW